MGKTVSARILDAPVSGMDVPERDPLLARLERAENFPVALRILPVTVRQHLLTVYDVARVIDDTGDELAEHAPGDRRRRLLALRGQLHRAWDEHPPTVGLLGRLAGTVRACRLEREPFDQLIEANLQDQTVARYRRFPDLLGYCALSAEPIGRLVLAVFGASTPATVALSDPACSALQILEHCQDIGEDHRQDRIYLPQEDLARFGVPESDFAAAAASPALRALVRFEAERAGDLLRSSRPLVGQLHGWARIAVAGYLAGGLATLDAIRRVSGGVLPEGPRPRKRDVLRHAVTLLLTARAHEASNRRSATRPSPGWSGSQSGATGRRTA
jgi:squalene synthase HpnC